MTTKLRLHPTASAFAVGACLLTPMASAVIIGPYSDDANTLQLWHMNEASGYTGNLTNSASGGFAVAPLNIDVPGGSGNSNGTANSNIMGASGFSGFGNAADFSAGGDDGIINPNSLTVEVSDVTGASGAFTFEALVRPSAISGSGNISILTLENNSNSASARPFQFRINDSGGLEFLKIAGGTQTLSATIPTSGDDAFVSNEWFHVAVTYNGSENTADNLTFYWTLLDGSRTEANPIGSSQMTTDLSGGGSNFGIGNDGRDEGNTAFPGLMDEIRVSNIARDANDMMFATIPEPSAVILSALAGMGLLIIRRRKLA